MIKYTAEYESGGKTVEFFVDDEGYMEVGARRGGDRIEVILSPDDAEELTLWLQQQIEPF